MASRSFVRVGRRWLIRAVSTAALASGASTSSTCKPARRTSVNPNGLTDADWYEEQHQHIALGLPLVEEARQGWWHEVTRRLRLNGEDVNSRDPSDGCTLLHLASLEGRRRLVEELLERGAQLGRDTKGRTPLHFCAEHGSETVMATLVAHGGGAHLNEADDTGAAPVAIAARLGHVRLVRWLCTRAELTPCEPDRYGVTALHKAVSFGQLQCVEALVADARVRSCLDQPVGTPTVPDSYAALSGGETALHLACGHSYKFHHQMHTRIAKVLLAAGADPTDPNPNPNPDPNPNPHPNHADCAGSPRGRCRPNGDQLEGPKLLPRGCARGQCGHP